MQRSENGGPGRKLFFPLVLFVLLVMLLEGLARLAMPFVEHGADDGSWRRVWVAEHGEEREIYYDFDVYDSTLGWRSKPGLRDLKAFGDKTLNTNSLGFRGTREHEVEKAPGSTRILLLGDSFTFGDEVSDDDTFAHHLGELLPNSEVMNFGMHGYGHDQMLILYREEARRFRPDIVVVAFVYPDVYRNLLHFRDYAKPRFVADGEDLRLENSPVPTPEETLAREPFRSKLIDAIRLARTALETLAGRLEPKARALSLRILDALVEDIRADGAVPVFVYLPTGTEVGTEALRSEVTPEQERFLLDWCRERDVACASARADFSAAAARGARFATDRHWGPAGHRAAARALAKLLRSSGLSPPRRTPS